MPVPQNRQEFPDPHPEWRGAAEVDAKASRGLAKLAKLWSPVRAILESPAATLARYAHRLVDRTTGIPYSADELQTKIETDLDLDLDAKADLAGGNTWTGTQIGLVANGIQIIRDAETHAFAGTLNSGFFTHTLPPYDGTLAQVPSVVPATPTTGFTITASPYADQTHYLTPAGVLATGTINLPTAANSQAGQVIRFVSTQTVTAITIAVSGGGSIIEADTPLGLTADTMYAYQCVSTAASGTWVRLY